MLELSNWNLCLDQLTSVVLPARGSAGAHTREQMTDVFFKYILICLCPCVWSDQYIWKVFEFFFYFVRKWMSHYPMCVCVWWAVCWMWILWWLMRGRLRTCHSAKLWKLLLKIQSHMRARCSVRWRTQRAAAFLGSFICHGTRVDEFLKSALCCVCTIFYFLLKNTDCI